MRAKPRLGWRRQAGTLVSTKTGVNGFPVQNREIETAPLPSSHEPSGGGRALTPSPPGRTHKPALAPGRAPFACGPDAAAAARCGASRRQRARRGRRGSRAPPWPPSPGPQQPGRIFSGTPGLQGGSGGEPPGGTKCVRGGGLGAQGCSLEGTRVCPLAKQLP